MKYTKEYMQTMFHYVNDELFEGMLDMPEMYMLDNTFIKTAHDEWNVPDFDGICCPEGDTYFIGIFDELPEIAFFHVFVHELIHIYCMEYYRGFSGHWGWFKIWAEKAYNTFYYNKM